MSGIGEKRNFHRCDFGVGSISEASGAYFKPKFVLCISQTNDLFLDFCGYVVLKSVCRAPNPAHKTNAKIYKTLPLQFGHTRDPAKSFSFPAYY